MLRGRRFKEKIWEQYFWMNHREENLRDSPWFLDLSWETQAVCCSSRSRVVQASRINAFGHSFLVMWWGVQYMASITMVTLNIASWISGLWSTQGGGSRAYSSSHTHFHSCSWQLRAGHQWSEEEGEQQHWLNSNERLNVAWMQDMHPHLRSCLGCSVLCLGQTSRLHTVH